jgi:hypothetical protein
MIRDRTKDKERFEQLLKGWMEQFAHSLGNSDIKNYVQQLVIEPFLQYILQRSFPYLLLAITVFTILVIIVILIFVLLLLNHNRVHLCPFCDKTFSSR